MEPRLWELAEGNPDDEVRAIVRLRDTDDAPPGLRLVARFGDIATCRMRRCDIVEVREHPAVVSLKAPHPVCSMRHGRSRHGGGSRHYAVQRPDVPETGRGVVIGIVDFAADFANHDFRNDDAIGSTRMRSMYIMNERSEASGDNRYGRGRIYSREDIDAALATPDPYGSLGYHPGDYAPGGSSHGCHVMGIAASNGRRSGIRGMAPEAEIVFCQPDSSDLDRSLNFGDSVGVLECVDHILHSAGDAPLVINLSIGRHAGPHDGSTLVEAALDNLTRLHEGVIIVNSAGNYFSERVHASGVLQPGERQQLRWLIDPADRSSDEFELWYDNADELEVELEAPDGERFGPLERGEVADIVIGGELVGRFYHRPDREPGSQRHMANCFLGTNAPAGTWRVHLHGTQIANGRYDGWIERNGGQRHQSRFARQDADRLNTTGTIANAHNMISVGAFDGRDDERKLPFFSSSGPTLDGRTKPDLLAPGVAVMSSASTPLHGRGSRRAVKSGTSMSAPHVTGTVALMLEAAGRPLPVAEVRDALFATADPVPHAAEVHRSGNGYLNAAAAVTRVRVPAASTDHAGGREQRRAVMTTPHTTSAADAHAAALPVLAAGNTDSVPIGADADDAHATEDAPLLRGIHVSADGRHVTVRMPERANTTIAGLAQTLRLSPRRVFRTLLRRPAVVRYLWQNEIYNEAETPRWPGTGAARSALRREGNQEVTRPTDRTMRRTVTAPIFHGYELTVDLRTPLRFPVSAALRQHLAALQERREREARRRELVPVMQRVQRVLAQIRTEAHMLRTYMEMIARVLADPIKEVALVEMLLGIVNAMLQQRSARGQSRSRLRDMRQLKQRVEHLKTLAHRHMLLERPSLAGERATRDRHARRLLALLEGQRFLADLRLLVADAALVPRDDLGDIYDGLRVAYSALMVSPLGEQVVTRHILPFINQLASSPFDYSGIRTRDNNALAAAVQQAPTAPPPTTALTIAGELFLRTPDIVGNTPGPDSLAVSMLEIAAPNLMQRIMSNAVRNPANITTMSSRLYRAFCTAARLDRAQRVTLLQAIDSGDLEAVENINWSRGFQNSVGFGSIISVISLIALIRAIRSDDANTVQRWADIIGSLSGVVTGAATVARSLSLTSALMRNGMVTAGAKAIGVIGGIAAVVSGFAEASDRHARGDSTGMWLAIGGSLGGAATVGGFLIGLGATVSAGGVTLPIGAVLAVVGVVVSLGAAIWSLVRDWRTTSGHRLFEAILEHFGRRDGDFAFIARSRSDLRTAYRRVQTAHHDTRFWDVAFSAVPQLADMGFRDADIALLTDSNEAAVIAVLHVERPERYAATSPRRLPAAESHRQYALTGA